MEFDYRICVNEYGFYCVPDAYAKREIPKILAQGGVYEPNTLALLARRAQGGDIVTGGAFIGDFFRRWRGPWSPGPEWLALSRIRSALPPRSALLS